MKPTLRPGGIEDAKEYGRIAAEACKVIADQHNFPPDFPSAEIATGLVSMLLSHPRFYSVVAKLDRKA
jgi:hypothetical protein